MSGDNLPLVSSTEDDIELAVTTSKYVEHTAGVVNSELLSPKSSLSESAVDIDDANAKNSQQQLRSRQTELLSERISELVAVEQLLNDVTVLSGLPDVDRTDGVMSDQKKCTTSAAGGTDSALGESRPPSEDGGKLGEVETHRHLLPTVVALSDDDEHEQTFSATGNRCAAVPAATTADSSQNIPDGRRLSLTDSIGSFHSEPKEQLDELDRRLSSVSRNVSEMMRDLVQRFAHRTERFKERTVQPPTPSISSIDGVSRVSDDEEKVQGRQRRLDSFVPPTLGGALEDQAGVVAIGRYRIKIPRMLNRLRPARSIDPDGGFYICWLVLVTMAFLYNTAAVPLRAAFFSAPIYGCESPATYVPTLAGENYCLYPDVNDDNSTASNYTTSTNATSANQNNTADNNETTIQTIPGPLVLIGYFPGYQTAANLIYWWIADYFCDIVYVIDVVIIKRRIQFINNGLLETDSKAIFKNYASKVNFKLDVLSLTPLDIFYLVPFVNFCSLLRFPRVLKIQTFWELCDRLDQRVSSAHIVRIARTIFYMLLLVHCETCAFYAFSAVRGIGRDGWLYGGTGTAYLQCMYIPMKTALSIGNNPNPNNQLEYMFVNFFWLTGILVFAMLIGQIRDIFQAADVNRDKYRKLVDQTNFYLKSLNVPKELRDRVRIWFNYNWEHYKTLDENSLLLVLPKKMKTDLAINVHFNTLSKVKLFQDCDKNLLYDLVLKLKPVLYLPGDYICRKGEVGTEMYIVVMGQVEVVGGPNNSLVFATLREGSVFGEISLLALEGGNRRTADVRSKGYAQLFLLSKADFEEAMAEYPDVYKMLRKKAKRLLNQNKQKIQRHSSVEEVIRNRRQTPKLVHTVIQVVDEDSNIPEYLGIRRQSGIRPDSDCKFPITSAFVQKERTSDTTINGEVDEILIVEQTISDISEIVCSDPACGQEYTDVRWGSVFPAQSNCIVADDTANDVIPAMPTTVSPAKQQLAPLTNKRLTDTALNVDTTTVLEGSNANVRFGSPGVTELRQDGQDGPIRTPSKANLSGHVTSSPSTDLHVRRKASPPAPSDDVINSVATHLSASLSPFRPPSPVTLALPTDDVNTTPTE